MQKVQKHLDIQAKKAVRQATRRMADATPEDVGEEVVENEKTLAVVVKHKKARKAVVNDLTNEELLAEMKRRGLAK
jgi:hypothetical protein